MRAENLGIPAAIVLELEDGDLPVRRSGGKHGAQLMRSPFDGVDRGVVIRVLSELGELPLSFLPDKDFAVVGGGGEDVAEFGVRPGDLPDGAVVPAEGFDETVVVAVDFEDFDGAVGGAGLPGGGSVGGGGGWAGELYRETLAVVVERAVMLWARRELEGGCGGSCAEVGDSSRSCPRGGLIVVSAGLLAILLVNWGRGELVPWWERCVCIWWENVEALGRIGRG